MKLSNAVIISMLALAGVSVCSCSTNKENLTYFENVENIVTGNGIGSNDYGIKIVPDDELKIVVTSQVPEATAAYNVPMVNYATRVAVSVTGNPAIQTYVVDKKGDIEMPVLGKLHVEGLSTDEVCELIRKEVAKDVKDPYVEVRHVGFKVNVLGEVKNPGAKVVTKERYSIFDAIADAMDLTEYGRRDNVLLIREENGVKRTVRLNLNDATLLESPYFYLQQNDVIYVEPNSIKKENSKYNQNNSFKISVVSTIVSACSVLASLVIALTVK